jgi:hypothetical protein
VRRLSCSTVRLVDLVHEAMSDPGGGAPKLGAAADQALGRLHDVEVRQRTFQVPAPELTPPSQ